MLFGYESDAIMAVSHHDDPAMYKTYVINSSHVDHTFFSETSSESRSQLFQKDLSKKCMMSTQRGTLTSDGR